MNEKLKVSVARLLLAFMVNPVALMGSVHGADTDVYQGLTGSGGAGSGNGTKTNVLLILDTSDSMNIPEPWKEYDPDAYDSHAEYLWNSPNYISTVSTNVANGSGSNYAFNLSDVTTAGSSGNALNPLGSSGTGTNQMKYDSGWFFGGNVADSGTNSRAQALKDAALAYANGTNNGSAAHTNPPVTDGGPRYRYRNYAFSLESGHHGSHSYIHWAPSTSEADDRLRSFYSNKFAGANVVTAQGHVSTIGPQPPIWRGGISFGSLDNNREGYNLCESSKPSLTPSTVYAPTRHPRNAGKLVDQVWKRWERYSGLNDSRFSLYAGSDASAGGGHTQGYLDGHRDDYAGPVRLRVQGGGVDEWYLQPVTPSSDNDSYSRWGSLKPDWGSGVYYLDRLTTLWDASYINSIRYSNGFTTSSPGVLRDARRAFQKDIPRPDYVDYKKTTQVVLTGGQTISKLRVCTHTGQTTVTDADGAQHSTGGSCVAATVPITCSSSDPSLCALVPDPAPCALNEFVNESFTTAKVAASCHFGAGTTDSCAWVGRTSTYVPSIPGTPSTNCTWSGRTGTLVGFVPPTPGSEGVPPDPGNPGSTEYCGGTCVNSSGTTTGCTADPSCSNSPTAGCWGTTGTSGTPSYYIHSGGICQRSGGITAGCTGATADTLSGNGDDSRNCTGGLTTYTGCSGSQVVVDLTTTPPTTKTVAASCSLTSTDTSTSVSDCTTTSTRTLSTCEKVFNQKCTGCASTVSSAVLPSTTKDYDTYNRTSDGLPIYMSHDCLADDGDAGQYLKRPSATGVSHWLQNESTGYTNSASKGFTASSEPKISLYSSNYLNFKFGAKACRDSSGDLITATANLNLAASCKPLARKTRFQIAKDVLTDLVKGLLAANASVRLGLMAFNPIQKIGSAYKTNGAYLVKAVKDLDSASAGDLITAINLLDASAQTPLTESLYEAYLYYKGNGVHFGDDADGSTLRGPRDTTSVAMTGNATYKSPIEDGCQPNWVVLVTDGAPDEDRDANSLITALPTENGASILPQLLDPATNQAYGPPDPKWSPGYVLLDELARYMSKVDARSDLAGTQTVKLNTIAFAGANAPVLSAAAEAGGGTFYSAVDQASLLESLTNAVSQAAQWQPIGSPTTVYQPSAGASDTVYVPMYSPTPNVTWEGTVKKFKYGFGEADCGPASCGNSTVCMIGQTELDPVCKKNVEFVESDGALNLSVVKMRPEAVSFWGGANEADGAFGNKGGTGKILKTQSFSSRVVKTALTSGATISNLDVSVANKDLLLTDIGMSSVRKEDLIHFAQGGDGSGASAWRLWPSFDSVHSRPVTDDNDTPADLSDDTLYFVTSDGVLHSVNTDTGKENWAFMVEETFPQLTPIRDNPSGLHLQIAGGTPVVLKTSANKKLVVFGMRRGGRAYYAVDVTNTTPSLAWKIANNRFCNTSLGCQATTSASADNINYAELGQTWSTPVAGGIRGQTEPVLVFGGGYDPDADNSGHDFDTYGRAVFVTNGATGEKIKQFNLRDDLSESGKGYAVPSDVLALDTNGDALRTLDRAYVGDLGGNLWRLDLDDRTTANASSGWSKVKLAKLKGVHSASDSLNHNLKMFNRPTMASVNYDGTIFDAVFVGGGDGQQPTDRAASGVIYMVKDKAVALVATQLPSGDIPTAGKNCGSYPCFVDMTDATTSNAMDLGLNGEAAPATSRRDALKNAAGGWMVRLDDGEKVVTDCQVYGGNLYLGTFYPTQKRTGSSASACSSSGGYGRQMVMSAMSGMPLFDGTSLVNSAGNGRAYAGVYGLGRALAPVGTKGKPVSLGAPGAPTQKPGAQGGIRMYWYSLPEH